MIELLRVLTFGDTDVHQETDKSIVNKNENRRISNEEQRNKKKILPFYHVSKLTLAQSNAHLPFADAQYTNKYVSHDMPATSEMGHSYRRPKLVIS